MSNHVDAVIEALEDVEIAARDVMRDLNIAVLYGRSHLDQDKTDALNAALDKLDKVRSDYGVAYGRAWGVKP